MVPNGAVSLRAQRVSHGATRDAFGEGFDESLRVGEDVDFVWRLHDQGWLVRYVADVVVTHRARRRGVGGGASDFATARPPANWRVDTARAWRRSVPTAGRSRLVSSLAGQPAFGARVVRGAQRHSRERFFATEDDAPSRRATGRARKWCAPVDHWLAPSYALRLVVLLRGPAPPTTRRALALYAVGTAWRWRHHRLHVRDIPLAIADDLAYGVGVFEGAWRTKSLAALTPDVTKSDVGLSTILGLSPIDAERQVRFANATTKALARWKNVLARLTSA